MIFQVRQLFFFLFFPYNSTNSSFFFFFFFFFFFSDRSFCQKSFSTSGVWNSAPLSPGFDLFRKATRRIGTSGIARLFFDEAECLLHWRQDLDHQACKYLQMRMQMHVTNSNINLSYEDEHPCTSSIWHRTRTNADGNFAVPRACSLGCLLFAVSSRSFYVVWPFLWYLVIFTWC